MTLLGKYLKMMKLEIHNAPLASHKMMHTHVSSRPPSNLISIAGGVEFWQHLIVGDTHRNVHTKNPYKVFKELMTAPVNG